MPQGTCAILGTPSLGADISLSYAGEVEISGGEFIERISVSPVGVHFPGAVLLKASSFCTLRSAEAETGISTENGVTKHFFAFNQPLQVPSFALKFKVIPILNFLNSPLTKVAGASYQLDKEKGYLAFFGKSDKPILAYSVPVLRCNKQTIMPEFEWKPLEYELHINFVGVTYPFGLAFTVSNRVPLEGSSNVGLPFALSGGTEESDSSSSESDTSDGDKSRGFSVCAFCV